MATFPDPTPESDISYGRVFWLLIVAVTALLALGGCEPVEDDAFALGGLAAKPTIRVEVLAEDPNRVVLEDLSEGVFARVWDLPGATPNSSTERLDTVLYTSAGTYEVRLFGNATGGGGAAMAMEMVEIEQDATNQCSETLTLLAGGCEATSEKCWTFTRAAGAIGVGPTPGSREWFESKADDLQDDQYDDAFCFGFEGASFTYVNNGLTVDPNQGYSPVPYDPLEGQTYQLLPGAGEDGETRIQLPEGNFLGVLDAGNYYDIVTLTETELVVRGPFLNGDGWFELTFVAL